MKGKLVNLQLGFLDLLIGILLILFTTYIPTDNTILTVQENEVVDIIRIGIYGIVGITAVINFFAYLNNKTNYGLSVGYRLFLLTVFFVVLKHPTIAAFPIAASIFIIFSILKENIREINSTFVISILAVVIGITVILGGMIYFYKYIGTYILNKKNESQIKYKTSFFQYITELDGYDIYINVKKDGKFGYINSKGETVIDFKYDYASPFTTVGSYNKTFQVALVCENGISKIIMKNERVVMSYVSESSDENYEQKIEELRDFYTNTMGMKGRMKFEIDYRPDDLNYAPVYHEKSEEYSYRYDYNNEYDIIVTQSSMGRKDTYALARKNDFSYQLPLDCDHLDYDEDYLYLYQDGTIPFYNTEKQEQGWFSPRGVRKLMKGNAQILEKIGDKFLYKDYNKGGNISFYNENGEKLSDSYKEIFIQDGRYVVKKLNDKYTIIDEEYKPIIEGEYDYIDISLIDEGLYLVGNLDADVIEFNTYDYADMNFSMMNYDGEIIATDLDQVYSKYYKSEKDENKAIVANYNDFVDSIKTMNVRFVGDKFYKK